MTGQRDTNEDRLRLVLRANAGFSLIGGLAAVAAGGALAEMLGVNVWLLGFIGVALIIFSGDVWLVSRRSGPQMASLARLISMTDAVWVAATVVIIALGVLSTAGSVLTAIVGVIVADFAIMQWRSASRVAAPGLEAQRA